MITYSELGRMGRLGNALFQIATTLAHANKMGASAAFPSSWEYRQQFPRLAFRDSMPDFPRISEEGFHYSPLPEKDDIDLWGYFQSPLYFDDIFPLIRSIFPYSKKKREKVCSVHVRRGDYLELRDYHPVQPLEYFTYHIENSKGIDAFLVFSDDPDWCRSNLGGIPRTEIVYGNTPVEDMEIMTGCERHIISNSSFSWWGAYLSNSPYVIHPRIWFGNAYAHYSTKDLIPPHWLP